MSAQDGGDVVGALLVFASLVLQSRAWLCLVVATFAAAFASDASAYAVKEIRSEYVANRTINTVAQIDKGWVAANDAGGVRMGKNFSMAAPGGRVVAAEASAVLARGVVLRLAAGAVPLLGAASLAYELYDLYRIRPGTCAEGGLPSSVSNLLCFDAGTGQIPTSAYYPNVGGLSSTCLRSTPVAAGVCAAEVQWVYDTSSSHSSISGTAVCTTFSGSVCTAVRVPTLKCDRNVVTGALYNCSNPNRDYTIIEVPATGCPTGLSPGIDGKCATGLYVQPLTPEEAAAVAMGYANAGHPDLDALTREALGVVPLPVVDGVPAVEVGNVLPSSLEGPVKTTTRVEAGETVTQTEAIGWDWSRDPLRKTEGKWAETKTTTTRNEAGEVIKQETESEEGTTPGDKTDAVNQCKLSPNSIGCAEFGEVPAVSPVPTVALPASMDERITFGADTAACPSPRSIHTTLAGTIEWSWEGSCMFADGIRPVVVGLAYLSAVLGFFGFARRD